MFVRSANIRSSQDQNTEISAQLEASRAGLSLGRHCRGVIAPCLITVWAEKAVFTPSAREEPNAGLRLQDTVNQMRASETRTLSWQHSSGDSQLTPTGFTFWKEIALRLNADILDIVICATFMHLIKYWLQLMRPQPLPPLLPCQKKLSQFFSTIQIIKQLF